MLQGIRESLDITVSKGTESLVDSQGGVGRRENAQTRARKKESWKGCVAGCYKGLFSQLFAVTKKKLIGDAVWSEHRDVKELRRFFSCDHGIRVMLLKPTTFQKCTPTEAIDESA